MTRLLAARLLEPQAWGRADDDEAKDDVVVPEEILSVTGVEPDPVRVRACMLELASACAGGAGGELSPAHFVAWWKAALTSEVIGFSEQALKVAQQQCADVLWLLDMQLNAKKESRDGLIALVKAVASAAIIPTDVLQTSLEVPLLEKSGVVASGRRFFGRYAVRHYATFGTQPKYNMLAEMSEGYAKLLSELFTPGFLHQLEQPYERLSTLIGTFSLDPLRVIDLVLLAMQLCDSLPQRLEWVPLIQQFPADHVLHVVCHVTRLYDEMAEDDKEPVDDDVLRRCDSYAILLHHNVIELNDLYPYLSPSDDDAKALVAGEKKARLAVAEAHSKVNNDSAIAELQATVTKCAQWRERSSKLALLRACIERGFWPHALALLHQLAPFDPLSHAPVSQALGNMMGPLLDPMHELVTPWSKPSRALVSDDFAALSTHVFPLLPHLGHRIAHHPILFTKLCRVLAAWLRVSIENEDEQGIRTVEGVCLRILLPGLSLLYANVGATTAVWDILQQFPYTTRFRLYHRWKSVYTHVDLQQAKNIATREARFVLRRLSTENVKLYGRYLGKASHANPLLVLHVIVARFQVPQYDNIIEPVVDCLKYLSKLSYDVLTFVLLDNLCSGGARLKQDGTSATVWLSSLAKFCGFLHRKYGNLRLQPLLTYLLFRLVDRDSLDLIVLKELITRMSGIEHVENLSDHQLAAQGGGPVLKANAAPVPPHRATKRAGKRLADALMDGGFVVPLITAVSQVRSHIVFGVADGGDGMGASTAHIKMVADMYDKAQVTVAQLIAFVGDALDAKVVEPLLPSLHDMLFVNKLDPASAFHLTRVIFSQRYREELYEGKLQEEGALEEEEEEEGALSATKPSLVTVVKPLLPPDAWNGLSPELYATFWALSLYDLLVPSKAYQTEVARQRRLQQDVDVALRDIDEASTMTPVKARKEKDRLQLIADKLDTEHAHHKLRQARIRKQLNLRKNHWLTGVTAHKDTVGALLQHCLYPRVLCSPEDAVYAARFVILLQELRTPCFSMLQFMNTLMRQVPALLASCTENEASRFGRFINELLTEALRWRNDRKRFDAVCARTPGFSRNYTSTDAFYDYDDFRDSCKRWFFRLSRGFLLMLSSTEYAKLRNALIVLTRLVSVFPVLMTAYDAIEGKVRVLASDSREDLKVMALGYQAKLMKQKSRMVVTRGRHRKASGTAAGSSRSGANSSERRRSRHRETAVPGQSSSSSSSTTATATTSSRSARRGSSERGNGKSGRDEAPSAASSSSSAVAAATSTKRDSDRDRPRNRDRDRDRDRDRERSKRDRDGDSSTGATRQSSRHRATSSSRRSAASSSSGAVKGPGPGIAESSSSAAAASSSSPSSSSTSRREGSSRSGTSKRSGKSSKRASSSDQSNLKRDRSERGEATEDAGTSSSGSKRARTRDEGSKSGGESKSSSTTASSSSSSSSTRRTRDSSTRRSERRRGKH